MSTALFWAALSLDWPTLLSTLLSNELFWELFLVIYSWEQFFEPSFEQCNSFEHFFEHSQECTYSQEHFFEWIYSHECSFGHFLEGSRSTRTYLSWPLRFCRPGRICWYIYLPIIIPTAFVALDFFTAPTMILFQLCRRTRHYDPEHCTCKACKKRDISLVCQAWVDCQSVQTIRRCFHFFFSRSR